MNFETILLWGGFVSMVVTIWAVYFAWCKDHHFQPLSKALERFRRLPWYGQVIVLCFVGGFVSYGGSKTNAPSSGVSGGTNAPPDAATGGETNAPPLLMMAAPSPNSVQQPSTGFTEAQVAVRAAVVGVRTNETHDFSPPAGAHVVERWRLRGAANERVALVGATNSGVPPQIEGEGIAVDTFGRIRTAGRVFVPLGIQLGMVPKANWARVGAASLCWWMVTASNSTVVCWQNALLNRDTNTPVSVQAEFFDNGKFEYRYDLSSLGEGATNVFARIETTNGVEGVRLGVGVTTVRGHLLGPDDGWLADKDNDGLTTYEEVFVYGTDPELPDTDGDGRSDGEEVYGNGGDPLVGDVPDAEIVARIGAGVTNEEAEIVSGELKSTKLWDGFAFYADPGTNELYTRTFEVDRQKGWTSCFLSGRGEEWCSGGEDMVQDWRLIGCVVEWSDDTGLSGTVSASPLNDSLYLPVATNATSVTITLRGTVDGGRHASPSPLFFLTYSPKVTFPSGQEILGNDGNTYCVFTDQDSLSFGLDESNRPCRASAGEGEATVADFRMPSGPGVYRLPHSEALEPDAHPLLLGVPLLGAPPPGPPGDRYLVILDPWVSYGGEHYGCWHDYPYDWGWYGYWCDCEPECGCGVDGYAAVDCYIDWYDSWECAGVVEVGGVEVWRDYAYHIVWGCDHDPDDDEGYCPCGCDETCIHCSCMKSDGPSQGSIRFRVGLGTDYDDQKIGFAWFESAGPVRISPQLFEVDSRPDVYVRDQTSGGTRYITTYETHGRDLTISTIQNGVAVAVKHHGAAYPFETWEVTNVSNLNSVVRLVKRDGNGETKEDWTYTCPPNWVWEVTDNISHEYEPTDPTESSDGGTNWVYGVDGRVERLSVTGTNGEEVVIRSFSYDVDGRLVLVDDGTNGCVSIAYDESGNISEMTGPDGTLRAAWDENGVMTNLDTSAWNGDIPDSAQPQMAPRRRLLGAPNGGGGMSPLDALDHFLDGSGEPMYYPFSAVDTDWLTPTDFECVRSFIQDCHSPDDYWVSGTRVISTKGVQQYFLGHITIQLDGWITYLGNCNWTFDGTMWALDDTYDFNAAMRGRVGETLTSIGRWLFTGNGRSFTIHITGSKPLTGTGHCHE